MRTILQVCAYGAEYGGNFIASLEILEEELEKKGYRTIYAFCDKANDKGWCKRIEERTKVYYLPEAKARILPRTYLLFNQIYKENEVDIVHTHFELYDIPATVMAKKKTAIYWHLHDPINVSDGMRGLLWKVQYGVVGKRAILLSVSDFYRKEVIEIGFPEEQSKVVLNGIDTSRLEKTSFSTNPRYQFLTLGWDFYRKGDDIIIEACKRLYADGYEFSLLLNGNESTWPILEQYLDNKEYPFLVKGYPTKEIGELYKSANIFIQASRKETFSYAVCEASYMGMPVISSDIAGLEWAHMLPTVTFFENENVEELYNLMKTFLDGKQFVEKDYNQTKAIINSDYTLHAWAHKIMRIYNLGDTKC